MSNETGNASTPSSAGAPDATLAGWIGLSVFVSTVVAILLGVGVASAFGKLAQGGSFGSAGWLIGSGGGLAVGAVLFAVGFVRFRIADPRSSSRTV